MTSPRTPGHLASAERAHPQQGKTHRHPCVARARYRRRGAQLTHLACSGAPYTRGTPLHKQEMVCLCFPNGDPRCGDGSFSLRLTRYTYCTRLYNMVLAPPLAEVVPAPAPASGASCKAWIHNDDARRQWKMREPAAPITERACPSRHPVI